MASQEMHRRLQASALNALYALDDLEQKLDRIEATTESTRLTSKEVTQSLLDGILHADSTPSNFSDEDLFNQTLAELHALTDNAEKAER